MIFPGIEGFFAWMERENKLEDNAQKKLFRKCRKYVLYFGGRSFRVHSFLALALVGSL